jgi:hypothetical protein
VEDAKPLMKENGVRPALIHNIGAALTEMGNKNQRKRKNSETDEGGGNQSGGSDSGSTLRAKAAALTMLYEKFDSKIVDLLSGSLIDTVVVSAWEFVWAAP